MISVIIPTMWRYAPFLNFIETLVDLGCIGEIIILNNDVSKTPRHNVLKHSKVKLKNFPANIYVNPAWNRGAELARHENLCFLSDDVIIDLKAFVMADRFMSDHTADCNIGVIGICPGSTEEVQRPLTNGVIEFANESLVYGWASCFFVPKQYWVPIPETIKLFWGDMWQVYSQIYVNNRLTWSMHNCFYHSPNNVTWKGDSHLEDVIESDTIEWCKIMYDNFENLRKDIEYIQFRRTT